MKPQHQQLADGKWESMDFFQQMANVGSEVERAIRWNEKKNAAYGRMAFERSLELLDFTIADRKNRKRLKELLRLREFLADYFFFGNIYRSTKKSWQNYFFSFNYAARLGR
ncbi:MAG: hypothetical protein PHF35_01000 [Candidatus Moranbacteria bacterium]|nr:hypothetical protein [Candidatus Moranbacteria bacterium]